MNLEWKINGIVLGRSTTDVLVELKTFIETNEITIVQELLDNDNDLSCRPLLQVAAYYFPQGVLLSDIVEQIEEL